MIRKTSSIQTENYEEVTILCNSLLGSIIYICIDMKFEIGKK